MLIVTLSNGKKVANFSSPHPFKFTDGSELPACSAEKANELKIRFNETASHNGDIVLSFELTDLVSAEMQMWQDKYLNNEVDVVFCPLPMIQAIKESLGKNVLINSPFRAIRIEDRNLKLVSIEKQCI